MPSALLPGMVSESNQAAGPCAHPASTAADVDGSARCRFNLRCRYPVKAAALSPCGGLRHCIWNSRMPIVAGELQQPEARLGRRSVCGHNSSADATFTSGEGFIRRELPLRGW